MNITHRDRTDSKYHPADYALKMKLRRQALKRLKEAKSLETVNGS